MPAHLLKIEVNILFAPQDEIPPDQRARALTREQVLDAVGKQVVNNLTQHVPEECRCGVDIKSSLHVKARVIPAGGKN